LEILRSRGNIDASLTQSGNARSQQLIVMPTEQLIVMPKEYTLRMAARRALEWVRMFKGLAGFTDMKYQQFRVVSTCTTERFNHVMKNDVSLHNSMTLLCMMAILVYK